MSDDPFGPHRRAYEQTAWGKLVVRYKQFGPAFSVAVAVLVLIGFQFQTPAQWFRRIEEQVEAVEMRTSALEQQSVEASARSVADRQEIMDRLNTLVRFQCVDMSPRERSTQSICLQVGIQ